MVLWFYLFLFLESESEVAQSCPILCDPMDCSLPGLLVIAFYDLEIFKECWFVL